MEGSSLPAKMYPCANALKTYNMKNKTEAIVLLMKRNPFIATVF